jgi:hypothetical protein
MDADIRGEEEWGNGWSTRSFGSMGKEFKLQLAGRRQAEA